MVKRIISIFCTAVLLLNLISVQTFFSGVCAETPDVSGMTELYAAPFLNRDGEEITVSGTAPTFPESVHRGNKRITPAPDPSGFSLDCGFRYDNADPTDSSAQFLTKPVTYADYCGCMLYVKAPSGSTAHPKIYLIYHNGTGGNTSKYQYSGAVWYTMTEENPTWASNKVSGYGITLPEGFAGYLYLPFDAFRNNAAVPNWKADDEICGLLLWDDIGADELIYSKPLYVRRGTLSADTVPSADAVRIGDRQFSYFGNDPTVLEPYYGDAISYGNIDFTALKTVRLPISLTAGSTLHNCASYWDGNTGKCRTVESTVSVCALPMFSSSKPTSESSSNYWLGSVGVDASTSSGGEAVMFYLKLPENLSGRSLTVDFGFDDTVNTYTYSGTYKIFTKEDHRWRDVSVRNYRMPLPDGFEGFVAVPYSQMRGATITAQNCVTSMNLRVTDLDGNEPTVFSAPIIVTHFGETPYAYLLNGKNAARNLFTGNPVTTQAAVYSACGYNVGDVTGNGTADIRDLVRLKKGIAAPSVTAYSSGYAADMNADSAVNASDGVLLCRYLLEKSTAVTEKSYLPMTSDGDRELLLSPDRGFRTHLTLYLKEAVDSGDPIAYYREDYKVFFGYASAERINSALVYIYLTDYRNMDIPAAGIEALRMFFEYAKAEEFKVMLNFAYCDDYHHPELCANQATILRHIRQLAPVVAEYKDCIHTVEGGFIGSYGEWAACYQSPAVDYETVIRALMEHFCMPNGLYLCLRLPEYKNLIPKTDPYYRYIGTCNDAMYGEQTKSGWHSGGFQLGTASWAQVCEEGAYTPQGGEMLNNSSMLAWGCVPTGLEMLMETAHHWQNTMSVWHGMFETKTSPIMNNWRTETVTPQLLEQNHVVYCPSWFVNDSGERVTRSAYDFIRDHLGYKIELQGLSVTGSGEPGSTVQVSLSLKNYGMSAAFGMRGSFCLLDENNRLLSEIPAGNPEEWYSHDPEHYLDTTVLTHRVTASLRLPAQAGNYRLAFRLENSLGKAAHMSNRMENVNGYYILNEFLQ